MYQKFLALTREWWFLLLVLVATAASFYLLFSLVEQFELVTGVPPFDTQNALSSEQITDELPLYTGEALNIYYRFAAFDFVFPLVSAMMLVVLWVLLLRFNRWNLVQTLLNRGFPLLPLLITAFDYGENICFLLILNGIGVSGAALFFKQLKLAGLSLAGGITAFLFLLLILNWLYRLIAKKNSA